MDSTRGISLSKVCLTNILNQWMLFDRIFNLKRTFLTTMIVSMRCITKGWIKQSNKAIEFLKLKKLLKYELLISWTIIDNKYKANFSVPNQPDAEHIDSCYTIQWPLFQSNVPTWFPVTMKRWNRDRMTAQFQKWVSVSTLRVSIKVHWRVS